MIDVETAKPATREEAAELYAGIGETYKPKAPTNGTFGVSQQEINDLFTMRRVLQALSEADNGDPHCLAARLTIHDLGLALIVFDLLEKASTNLDGEIDNCFPDYYVTLPDDADRSAAKYGEHWRTFYLALPDDFKEAVRAVVNETRSH